MSITTDRHNNMAASPTDCDKNLGNSTEEVNTGTDYIGNNKRHFDDIAARYDNRPGALKLSRAIASAIVKDVDLDEESTMLMEYACGTGKSIRNLVFNTNSVYLSTHWNQV